MLEEIEIIYSSTQEEWREAFKKGLDEHGIIYTDEMITNMCVSLNNTIYRYLTFIGYRPKFTHQYRVGFTKRMGDAGLKLSIYTNNLMWKYLEYFTDIKDYSKCFDINIVISDYDMATKDMIFVGVSRDNKIGVANHPKYSKDYISLTRQIELLKIMANKDLDRDIIQNMLKQIIDILDIMIRSKD